MGVGAFFHQNRWYRVRHQGWWSHCFLGLDAIERMVALGGGGFFHYHRHGKGGIGAHRPWEGW